MLVCSVCKCPVTGTAVGVWGADGTLFLKHVCGECGARSAAVVPISEFMFLDRTEGGCPLEVRENPAGGGILPKKYADRIRAAFKG